MVTENNSQINTFTGGMNTDTSYQSLLPDRYISAKNIRVSATNRTGESDASNVHGVIRPIEGVAVPYNFNFFDIHGIPKDTDWSQYGDHASRILGILAADVVRNYGVIIAKVRITTKEGAYGEINRSKDGIAIYRIEVPETPIEDGIEREPEDILDDALYTPQLTCVWQSFTTQQDGFIESDNLWCEELSDLPNRLSIQLRWEDDDNVKLYIATTVTPLLVFNISPTHDSENQSHNGTWEHNSIYPSVTFEKPIFAGYSSGTLPAGLVQYSYSFYNKNGQQSEISPSTRLIPIVKWSNKSIASSYDGYLDEETSQSGVSIKIPIKDNKKWFTYLKIYRIYYALNGQAPTVGVIYDAKFLSNYDEFTNKYLSATDSGQTLLEQLTLEEYNSVSGIHIIPKVLESKNDYLFAANIKTPNTEISGELFREWDARAYQFDYHAWCRIGQYGSDDRLEFGWQDIDYGYVEIPQDADCFNPINDMDKEWRANSQYDYKYDKDGYYGGSGKNVSWRFVISQLYGDHSIIPTAVIPDILATNTYSYSVPYNGGYIRVPTLGTASRCLNTENHNVEVYLPTSNEFEDWDGNKNAANVPNNAYLAIDHNNDDGGGVPKKITDNDALPGKYITYNEWSDVDITFNAKTIKACYIKCKGGGSHYEVEFVDVDNDKIENTANQYFAGAGMSNTYADPQAMYFLKSLRRDELYRYGIILYDKFGNASPVKWIADIRTPSIQELGFQTFASHVCDRDLAVRPLGIQFTVKNLPEGCAGYEIVRCNRTYSDISNISLGVISRPIKKKAYSNYTGTSIDECYTPTGFLTTGRFWTGVAPALMTKTSSDAIDILSADNFNNHGVFLFVSPEVVYQFENMKSVLTDNSYYISPVKYVFGQSNINSGVDDFLNNPIGDVDNRDGYEYTGNNYEGLYLSSADHRVPIHRNNIILHPAFGNANLLLFRMATSPAIINSCAGERYEAISSLYGKYRNTKLPIGLDSVLDTLYYYTENGRREANSNLAIGISSTSVRDAFYRINAKGTRLDTSWKTLVDLSNQGHDYSQIDYLSTLDPTYSLYKKNPAAGQYYHVPDINKDFFEKNGTYIKLYEQADTVVSRALTKSFTIEGDGIDAPIYAGGVTNKISGRAKINNISFAEEMQWNDFLSAEAVDKDNVQLIYPLKTSIVGNNEYCNFVTGGLYNVQFSKYNGEEKYGLYDRYKALHNSGMLTASGYSYPQGPGGRCILLQVDDPLIVGDDAYTNGGRTRILSDTIGCHTILTHGYTGGQDSYNDINPIVELSSSIAEPTEIAAGITLSVDREDNYRENGEVHRTPVKGVNLVYRRADDGSAASIFRNSIAGTFICNLKKQVTPYGGYSYQNRMLNVYYSYGNYFINSSNNEATLIFDGDCIIYPLEYVSMHKAFSADFDDETLKPTTQITYAIPLESTICVPYSSGEEFSKRVLKLGDPYKATTLQIQPDNISGIYTQSKPMYEYNTVYNTNSTSRVFAAYNYALDEDYDGNNMDYRCYYSNLKTNDEIIDSWTKFQSANYIDVDTKYGPITQLKKFNNSLMFWQQSAFGKLSVNERVQISTDSNTPIILGNGGILDRYDYIDTTSGMAKDQYCTTISNAALYWWDAHNQEIKSYRTGNSVVRLSKQGRVQSKMHEKENQVIPTMFFDLKYDELVSNVLTEDNKEHVQIAYNEQFNVFTSLYDIDYSDQLQFPTRTYLINISDQALDIAQWNKLQSVSDESKDANVPRNIDGSPLLTSITFAVNRSPVIAKVFDNQEIVSPNILGDIKLEGNSRVPYFKKHDGNETGAVEYTWKTDIAETSSDNLYMTYREGNYRYAIPRETIDGAEAKYGNRMRGKYMVCSIDDTKPNYNAAISYIITKFRVSWA